MTLKSTFTILLLSTLLVNPCFSNDTKYKIVKNELEVFGYKLPLSHQQGTMDGHYVQFLNSPNSNYIIVLSYLHLQGEYDVWLYDNIKKAKPSQVNATHVGRHPELEWYSEKIFSISWAGMGYYTSGIYHVSDIETGTIVENLVLIDADRQLFVAYVEDVFKTGIIVGKLFDKKDNYETFYFDLAKTEYVTDRYESVENIQIIGDTVHVQFTDNGEVQKYKFNSLVLSGLSTK